MCKVSCLYESNFSVRLLLCAFPERERDRLSIRTCVAMVEKFPEYAVYSAKIVFVWPLVNATKAYMSGIVLFVCGLGARVCL